MKLLALFSAILAVAMASPGTWTANELADAIQNPNTHESLIPILESALNELMDQIYAGNPVTSTTVSTVVQDFSLWTMHELSEAIQNPETDPELLNYLEYALNTMMTEAMSGYPQEYIIIPTPIGLLPIEQAVPVVPVDSTVVPPSATSPLVQIIVNVKSQQQPSPVNPAPEPSPPVVIPQPVVLPEPVFPVVIPQPVVLPEPVLPEMAPPLDIIAVFPDGNPNPIDVIAVAAPDVPVDAVHVVGPHV